MFFFADEEGHLSAEQSAHEEAVEEEKVEEERFSGCCCT